MNYPTIASSQTFSQRIERECIIDSEIAPSLHEAAIEIIEDTGFWEPNHALNHKISIQWKTQAPHSFKALAAFMQEDGSIWQGKPDQPRTGRDGKLNKYESPLGQSVRAYQPPTPPVIRQLISQHCGVEFPSDGSFWDFVAAHPEIPIVLTEGGKKGLCLLSVGYAAIALLGVNGGCRTRDSEDNPVDPYLIPDLQRFAAPGRRFIFAFDRDEKLETVRNVTKAKWTLGQLLQAQGCEVVDTHWHSSKGKGIDDFRVNQGEERLHKVLADWLPLEKPLEPGEPLLEEYSEYRQWEEDQALAEQAEAEEREQQQRDRWKVETERIQAELNSLRVEPTIRAAGRYIPKGLLRLPDKPGITLVDGTMGVGKTATALKGLVEQHQSLYPKALQWLFTPRNLLGLQSGAILGLPHHSTAGFGRYGIKNKGASCLESVGLINLSHLPSEPPLLVFDEAGQIFKQVLYGDTCRSNHAFIIQRLRELFRRVAELGGWIVLSEDGLTNLELDFVRDAAGMEVVEHLKFTKEVTTPRSYQVYDSPTITWDEILIRLDKDENVIVASDSQGWLAELERWLKNQGIDSTFVTGKTSQEDWAVECVKNPTQWVYEHRPRVFGYSPSMGSGISIDDPNGYFNAMAFHFTHLEPREAKQMCDRLRTDVPRFGYIKERAATADDLCSSSRPDLIIRDLRRNKNGVAKLIDFAAYAAKQTDEPDLIDAWQQLDEQWSDETTALGFYLKFYSRYKARENHGKIALAENLMDIWRKQGHQVVYIPLGKISHIADERKEVREELDQEDAVEWAEIDTAGMSPSQARGLLNDPRSTREGRLTAGKRLKEDKLPGTPLNDVDFVLKTIIQQNGRFLKTTELLWLSQHPEAAKQISRWNWQNNFSNAAKNSRFVIVHRLSVDAAKAKLLSECPLQPFIESKVTEWDNETSEAITVHEWAVLHRHQFRRYLRLTIKEDHPPVKTVNKLLRKLGFEVEQSGRKGSRGDQKSQYAITNQEDIDREIILKALTERFLSKYEEKQEATPGSVETAVDRDGGQSPSYGENTPAPSHPSWLSKDELDNIRQMWDAADCEEARSAIKQIIPLRVLQAAMPELTREALAS